MSLLDDVVFEVPLGFHSLTQRCAALVRLSTYAFPHMPSTAVATASRHPPVFAEKRIVGIGSALTSELMFH